MINCVYCAVDKPNCLGIRIAQGSTASTSSPTTGTTYLSAVDTKYFTFENSVFTCVKGGTYILQLWVKAGYNPSGTQIKALAQLMKNGTVLDSLTTTDNAPLSSSITTTLEAGDVVEVRSRNTTNSTLGHLTGLVINAG